MKEIAVEHEKPAVVAHGRDEIGAHRHERRGAAGRPVQAPEQLLPARLGGVVDLRRGRFAAHYGKARDRALDPRPVGAEILRQRPEERAPVVLAKAAVTAENFARQRHARGLAASADQRAAHVGERGRPVDGVARPWAELEHGASPFRDRGEEIGKESAVHAGPPMSRSADRAERVGRTEGNCHRRRRTNQGRKSGPSERPAGQRFRPELAEPVRPGKAPCEREQAQKG